MTEPRAAAKGGGRVLFVAPPIILPRAFAHYPMFSNLGMLQNAAILEKRGHEVQAVDSFFLKRRLNYRRAGADVFHVGAELDELEAELKTAKRPDAVVVLITMFSDAHKLEETYLRQVAEAVRRAFPSTFILAADCYVSGMNYFPYSPTTLLERVPELDCVLLGEADEKLSEVVDAIVTGGECREIAGVVRKARSAGREDVGGFMEELRAAPETGELDRLPYPAFHLLDMDNYFACMEDAVRLDLVHEYHAPERFLPLITSRGCKFACNFCTQQVLRTPWRGCSVEYLKRMIGFLRDKYRVERFLFLDNSINLDRSRFLELTAFMADRRYAWDAVNGFRADHLADEAIVLLKAAGNAKITISAESGDPAVLSGVVGKRQDLQHIVRVVKKSRQVGIPSQVHYVIGLPGETKKQINKTLEFSAMLYENYRAWPLLQHAIPFRETRLFRECEEKGYFARHPDTVPGYELENRPLIRTEEHSPDEILRFKGNFGRVLREMDETAVVDVGAGCNNNCLHCEASPSGGASPRSAGDWIQWLETERSRGARDVLIAGREPLLEHELVGRIIQGAARLGFRRRTLATNGRMLVYKRIAAALVKSGLESVDIRFPSISPSVHDRMTRSAGSFAQTLGGIRHLLHSGMKNVDISIPVTPANLPTLADTVRFLKRHSPRTIHLRYPSPLASVEENPECIAPYGESIPILARILSEKGGSSVVVHGVPFCLFDRALIDQMRSLAFYDMPRVRRLKAKAEKCEGCPELISCMGFWREKYEPYYQQGRCPTW